MDDLQILRVIENLLSEGYDESTLTEFQSRTIGNTSRGWSGASSTPTKYKVGDLAKRLEQLKPKNKTKDIPKTKK
jgi:hypothetical protein